jgi:D-glycero-alpha-D-manno-heptose-7-phosphate kinase
LKGVRDLRHALGAPNLRRVVLWHPCDETPDVARPRTVRATAPVRICDLGGWTDTWFAGSGRVLNVAVLPGVEARVRVGGPPGVVLDLPDLGDRYELSDGVPAPGRHPLLEAAVARASAGIPRRVGVEISVWSAVPPGSSLGSSAAVVVALLAALEALTPRRSRAGELVRAAHEVETTGAGRESGVQDQVAACYGGISWIEIDDYPSARVERLWGRVPAPVRAALGDRLVVAMLGRAHDSSDLHRRVIADLDPRRLDPLRQAAEDGRTALLAGDLVAFGAALDAATRGQAALHPDLVGSDARRALAIGAEHGSLGGKVNGAGGDGGSVALLLGPDADRAACAAALAAAGFAVFPAQLTEWGVRTWEEPGGGDEPARAGGVR